MYMLSKFDGHRSYGSQDVNSKKAEFTASIHHIEQILKIRNFEVPEKLLKRRRRRQKKSIAKRYAPQQKIIICWLIKVDKNFFEYGNWKCISTLFVYWQLQRNDFKGKIAEHFLIMTRSILLKPKHFQKLNWIISS